MTGTRGGFQFLHAWLPRVTGYSTPVDIPFWVETEFDSSAAAYGWTSICASVKGSLHHFPATPRGTQLRRREEVVCFNGVADKREEGPSMEAWLGWEHHSLGVSPSGSRHRHLLHCRSPALPLLLHRLQQADGKDHGGHEAAHLPAPCAIDLLGPVGIRQRRAHDAVSAWEHGAWLGPDRGRVLLGGGGPGGADACAAVFSVEFPVQVAAVGIVLWKKLVNERTLECFSLMKNATFCVTFLIDKLWVIVYLCYAEFRFLVTLCW